MTLLPLSVPHIAAVEVQRWTLDDFAGLRKLRSGLRAALAAVKKAPEDIERIAVVATELATNALRHGRPPTVVRLLRDGGRLILDVADDDVEVAPRVEPGRPIGAGGLGLQLAQTFATDVGWYRAAATKHVWASFPG